MLPKSLLQNETYEAAISYACTTLTKSQLQTVTCEAAVSYAATSSNKVTGLHRLRGTVDAPWGDVCRSRSITSVIPLAEISASEAWNISRHAISCTFRSKEP